MPRLAASAGSPSAQERISACVAQPKQRHSECIRYEEATQIAGPTSNAPTDTARHSHITGNVDPAKCLI